MWANRKRSLYRQANAIRLGAEAGIRSAFGGILSADWFSAAADTEEEADYLHNLHKSNVRFANRSSTGEEP